MQQSGRNHIDEQDHFGLAQKLQHTSELLMIVDGDAAARCPSNAAIELNGKRLEAIARVICPGAAASRKIREPGAAFLGRERVSCIASWDGPTCKQKAPRRAGVSGNRALCFFRCGYDILYKNLCPKRPIGQRRISKELANRTVTLDLCRPI